MKSIELNHLVDLLTEANFKSVKALAKNIFKGRFGFYNIYQNYIIEYSEKKLTNNIVKSLFTNFLSYYSKQDNKYIIITLHINNDEVKQLANKLNIILLSYNELIVSLLNLDNLKEALSNKRKEFINYLKPKLMYQNTQLTTSKFLQRIQQYPQYCYFVGGNLISGITSFMEYLYYELVYMLVYENKTLIPLMINASQFIYYQNYEQFLFNEAYWNNHLKIHSILLMQYIHQSENIIIFVYGLQELKRSSYEKWNELLSCLQKENNNRVGVVFFTDLSIFFTKYKESYIPQSLYYQWKIFTNNYIYQLKNFTLLDLKTYFRDKVIHKALQSNTHLTYYLKNPSFLFCIKNLSGSKINKINTLKDLVESFDFYWVNYYLTDMGKHLVLEIISYSILKQGYIDIRTDIPNYIENFVQINYKDQDLVLDLLEKDLMLCPIIKKIKEYQYTFQCRFYAFYFTAKYIEKNYLHLNLDELARLLEDSSIYLFLTSYEVLEFIKKNLYEDKEYQLKYLNISYQYFQYHYPHQNLLLKEIGLENTYFRYKLLTNLDLKNYSLSNSQFLDSDFRFSRYSDGDIESWTVENSFFDYSDFINCTYSVSSLENSFFRYCKFQNIKFINSKLSYIDISFSQWVYSRVHKSKINKINYSHNKFQNCQFKYVQGQDIYFNDNYWENIKIEDSHFIFIHFINSHLEYFELNNIQFINTSFNTCKINSFEFNNLELFASSFFNTSFDEGVLANIYFQHADLRKTQFNNIKMTKVNFQYADLRGSNISDVKDFMCPLTLKSLEDAIL